MSATTASISKRFWPRSRTLDAWLIAGPGETKKELEKYLDQHSEELKKKLIGVEAMDHPTDGELLAHARNLFKAHDRMVPHDRASNGRCAAARHEARGAGYMPFMTWPRISRAGWRRCGH